MYHLFPNIKGYLTNISITNAKTNSEYIAYFQPMYQFVNQNLDIDKYNKVNKTQILLNSYYFLNLNIVDKSISSVSEEGWYPRDATINSTISHELGHYITFVSFLKSKNIDNIVYETKTNTKLIQDAIKEYDSGRYSNLIVKKALDNYNYKNNKNYLLVY